MLRYFSKACAFPVFAFFSTATIKIPTMRRLSAFLFLHSPLFFSERPHQPFGQGSKEAYLTFHISSSNIHLCYAFNFITDIGFCQFVNTSFSLSKWYSYQSSTVSPIAFSALSAPSRIFITSRVCSTSKLVVPSSKKRRMSAARILK